MYNADIALHDLAGKILGIPVKKMICEECSDSVECYEIDRCNQKMMKFHNPGGNTIYENRNILYEW